MKQQVGFGATIAVAMAAVLGVSSQLTSRLPEESGAKSSLSTPISTNPSTAARAFDKGPCVEIEVRLQAFLLSKTDDSIAAPSSCFPASTKRPQGDGAEIQRKAANLRFVIATLPDPVHTHFALSFDRLTEAIQQAATDEQYIYDSSWLPWETDQASLNRIADRDLAEDRKKDREDQPGILLFRRDPIDRASTPQRSDYEEGLIVFVVGEEPTQGIHREQFRNAAAWIAALQPGAAQGSPFLLPPEILSPSFSGSLPSLNALLNDLKKQNTEVSIISGSVTSYSGVQKFLDSFDDPQLESTSFRVHFSSFQRDDVSTTERYCDYLVQSQFDLFRLAILSEDETAFGNESQHQGKQPDHQAAASQGPAEKKIQNCAPNDTKPARLFYPRDISALRSAYQKESIFNPQSSGSSGDSSRRTLATDMTDPEGDQHDTIREYSGNQTALSQEAVLQQIVRMLKIHQSEYILLRSSNPLDQLFLSHYLRQAYPQGRIIILGADLLLRRESGAARLSGIMTLSNYPLIPSEQHWTKHTPDEQPFNSHSHRVFPQEASEATYIATRFLLLPTKIQVGQRLTTDVAIKQLRRLGYSEVNKNKHSFKGNFTRDGDEIKLRPGPESHLSESRAKIHIKAGTVDSLTDENDKPLKTVYLREQPNFLPIDPTLKIPDTAAPFWIKDLDEKGVQNADWQRTPTWLSVIGRDDFWPVAALDGVQHPAGQERNAWAHLLLVITPWRARLAFANEDGDDNYLWPPMPLSMKIALISLILWSLFHLLCSGRPSITAKPSHRAYFVSTPGSLNPHRILLLLSSLALSSMATTLTWGFGAMSPVGEPLANPGWWLSTLLLLWIIVGASIHFNIWVQKETFKSAIRPLSVTLAFFTLGTIIYYLLIYYLLECSLVTQNRIPTYLRSMNLTSGVSPLLPLLSLCCGAYLWSWYSLQGQALFGPDRPQLPPRCILDFVYKEKPRSWMNMFSREQVSDPLEHRCDPLDGKTLTIAAVFFLFFIALGFFLAGEVPIRTLGPKSYSILICLLINAGASVMLANAWQLLHIWLRLSQLLTFLNRLRLRRSMAAFVDLSWGSVWKISGNVLEMRYRLLVRQLECVSNLTNSLPKCDESSLFPASTSKQLEPLRASLKRLNEAQVEFVDWYSHIWDKPTKRDQQTLQSLQGCFAETAGVLLTSVLMPAWQQEQLQPLHATTLKEAKENSKSEPELAAGTALEPHIRLAEQFVCYVYLGFIQNILGRLRSLVMSILLLFVATTVSLAVYPFDPRPVISGVMVVLFLVLGTVIVIVYAQMHRDSILSLLTNTEPGELGGDFWLKLVGFGAGPVLGLLATIFPGFTDFLFSWIQPNISSIK